MPELRIGMDPTNPGQFYACCGLFETFELYQSGSLACFETDGRLPHRADFVVRNAAKMDAEALLRDVRGCRITALPHDEPTIAPVCLEFGRISIVLNWWLKDQTTAKHPLKPWGGQQTSAGILRDLVAALPANLSLAELFDATEYTTTRLGVDPRSTWNKLDCGYSPNERDVKSALTAPAVDLFAAIGLQGFRPARSGGNGAYGYATWGEPLPRAAARAAAVAPWEGLPSRRYEFRLLDRGQGYKAFSFATER